MTKLLMLITSLAGGGAERVASELSLNLNQNIDRRIVILTDKVTYPSNESPLSLDIKFQKPLAISVFYAFIKGTVTYRRLIKENKPQFSLSFLALDNLINIASSYGNNKITNIISVHTSISMKYPDSLKNRIIKYMMSKTYQRADLIIAVSEGVRGELICDLNINPDKVKVLYNPVDLDNVKKLAEKEIDSNDWFDEDTPLIVNMGRLTRAKGQWHLIRAFSELRQHKKCKLAIIGYGELKDYLESLVEQLNLSDDVIFLGWQENPYKYISRASFFVLSSVWEALPYALTEAMACGCPIISTDCKYGPREILSDGKYGVLVPPMDGNFRSALEPLFTSEKCMSKAMMNFLDNLELRDFYSQKSKERAKDFAIEKCIQEYEKILNE
ncbi:glycosyltransferase [Methanosarcina sp. T3]|uniref:glycosyltransferase n=1 Tax=Methanosarcina sp. T3 TaxID=3439062 RepID=UPI003F865397